MKKEYHGKAIYQPSGKAAEYGEWACNFHIGCSNWCDYCFCPAALRPGLWSSTVTLKKAFKDEQDAIAVFKKELSKICRHYVWPDYFSVSPLIRYFLKQWN